MELSYDDVLFLRRNRKERREYERAKRSPVYHHKFAIKSGDQARVKWWQR